jgi:hypothetical protein
MRYLLMLIIFIAGRTFVIAQTSAAAKTAGQKKIQNSKKARQQRGTGQYHGSKDTTPGSPMGTGGAGGDMSGSPAGSAMETDDTAIKAEVQEDTIASQSAGAKKMTKKRKTIGHKPKSNL